MSIQGCRNSGAGTVLTGTIAIKEIGNIKESLINSNPHAYIYHARRSRIIE